VVATTALELGIDIGNLEAAVLAGYPGTIASTWQQAGRAGRGSRPALAVLVASANPLDQYLARFPDYFFGRPVEQALINPDNLLILLGHLRCAAFELPFQTGDSFGRLNPQHLQDLLEFLEQEGVLHRSGARYFWMAEGYPAQAISLRSASPESVLLHVEENGASLLIGEVDTASAAWMTHPGAVYLHEGQVYQVEALDLEHHTARLQVFQGDYYTDPRRTTTVQVIETLAETPVTGARKAYGEVLVTSQVIGYRKLRWFTSEPVGFGEVQLPPNELHTTGYWISIAESAIEALQEQGLWSAPNNYGPLWEKQRDLARARDGYRCQMCGLLEGDREHDVHHKTPFRNFTNPAEAHQLHNLVTLCPACHRKAESAVRMRSGLAGMAFVLANLAPLFLMCDPRDLGVHADSQALFANAPEKNNCGLVIYDQVPAGIGLSERLYEIHSDLLRHAQELVATCTCPDGCPSCVGPGGEGGSGGKTETLALLKTLLET
jgi:DEAD/DEAH box helicase domain-containing protein